MTGEAPIDITLWAGALAGAGYLTVPAAAAVAGWVKEPAALRPDQIAGRMVMASLLLLFPVALLSGAGLIAAELAVAVGTPPIAFPFVSLAALAGLREAWLKRGGGDAQGCNRIIGLFVAGYAVAWGATAWWLTGGPATLSADLASLRWIQPPLAALPFAALFGWLGGRAKAPWLFLGALALLSAPLALLFFTVEAGFAASLLPASDWLRFPAAALAAAALLAIVPAAITLRSNRKYRRRKLRDLAGRLVPFALVTLPMGIAWAAAKALVAAL